MKHSILITVLLVAAFPALAGGNAERGKALYQSKCAACHSIDYNGVGPAHKALWGRKAGSQAEFRYSDALKNSAVIWNETAIDKWLSNPEKFIPGQKMGFSVASSKERADLIAYLKIATQP
ncbi:cytochrome c [Oxalobacteraceae bacterium GrIS 2.11]